MKADKQRKILLVEDEILVAIFVKSKLEEFGYEVEIAVSGEKAVKSVYAGCSVDLMIMDINLGKGLDGLQAAEVIHKMNAVPVLFYTNLEFEDIEKRLGTFGFCRYINKKSGIIRLESAVKEVIDGLEAKNLSNEEITRI